MKNIWNNIKEKKKYWMSRKFLTILFIILMISCSSSASSKFGYKLTKQGLERLLLYYQGKEFIFLSEDTFINQFNINNIGIRYILNDILVDRKNLLTCTFNFIDENGKMTDIIFDIKKYTSYYDRDLYDKYIICYFGNNYYAIDINKMIYLNIQNHFDGMEFEDVFPKGYYSVNYITKAIKDYNSWKEALRKASNEYQSDSSSQNRNQQGNTNKLLALLLNPLSSGYFGQFTRGETVNIPKAFLRVIDLKQSENKYMFLVMVNDINISKPFYIIANKMFNLMDINYRNTIFEDMVIQYIGTDNYLSSGIPRETFVFQLSK